jgi:hypothetical protein
MWQQKLARTYIQALANKYGKNMIQVIMLGWEWILQRYDVSTHGMLLRRRGSEAALLVSSFSIDMAP